MSINTHLYKYPNAFEINSGKNFNSEFYNKLSLGNESYSRTMMYLADDKAKWGIIGHENTKKKLTTVKAMQSRSEGLNDHDGNLLGGINLFFTPNEFFAWKCAKQLSMLHANYIDIDTPKHKTVTGEESRRILRNALSQLEMNKVPAPNAIVSSGSGGWHLYWIYNPIEGYVNHQIQWRAIAAKLLSAIRSNNILTVDSSASSDPTRLLRLPGSFHLKAMNSCDCVYLDELYDFDVLKTALQINSDVPKPKKSKSKQAHSRIKHNIKDYWSKIYFKLLGLANDGHVSKKHCNRDIFLFLSMVALQHIKGSSEDALSSVKELNERFGLFDGVGKDSNPAQIDRYLSSCLNVRYKFSKEKLINWFDHHFNCDISDMFAVSKPKLSPSQRKKRQQDSAKQTHLKRLKQTKNAIIKALRKLFNDGEKPTMQKTAQIAGVTKRTIINHKVFYHNLVGEIWSASI